MNSVGIDPGKRGGICVIWESGEIDLEPMSREALVRVLRWQAQYQPRCCLEQVGAMPGQGVTSMFHFGEGYGYIQGVLEACGIPYQLIPPRRWKAEYGLNSDKAKSIEVARRLFPSVPLRTGRARTDQDGLAEALLMAEYARRRL